MIKKLKQKYQKEIDVGKIVSRPDKMYKALLSVQEFFNREGKFKGNDERSKDMCDKMRECGIIINN